MAELLYWIALVCTGGFNFMADECICSRAGITSMQPLMPLMPEYWLCSIFQFRFLKSQFDLSQFTY